MLGIMVLSVSAWSALALLLDRRGQLQVNRYFAALLAVLCVSQLFNYALLITAPAALIFGQIALASIWLKGPLVLQLVRLLIGEGARFRSIAWQFSGFPMALAINILAPQTQFVWHIVGACLSLAVLLWSLLVLRRYRHRILLIVNQFKNTASYWLLFVVLGMLVLLLMDIVLFAGALYWQAFPFALAKAVTYTASAYLVCIAFFSIYRPEIFFHSAVAEQEAHQALDGQLLADSSNYLTATGDGPAASNRNLELDTSIALILRRELEQLMTDKTIYRQADLSLATIAGLLGVSVHQTSELLNVHMQTNFYAYVNGYRLKYAAQLLQDPNCQLRVLDIAFESGFNNKNSFYREFRCVYAVTPSEYRSRQMLQALS